MSAVRRLETRLIERVQLVATAPPVIGAARGMSAFGEHAGGWIAIGVLAATVDRRRRREWLHAAAAVTAAHGASIALKQVVRRPRPDAATVKVLDGTPSRLSFPSAHACSTTAAAVLYGGLVGSRLEPILVPPMLLSRIVLGVHFPSDVLAGSLLGATIGVAARRRLRRRRQAAR